ncbi:unnamed protein product [Pleuronectes platessa]|uniref:Uncharacterized protein n=1 Tax=Pleuronectes platessa TaxID=8262 RepID=A0A9N7THU8_PLEPL|nr:unnamed protein product [Pleuronectes platessa]
MCSVNTENLSLPTLCVFLKTAHESFFCERKREENAGKKKQRKSPERKCQSQPLDSRRPGSPEFAPGCPPPRSLALKGLIYSTRRGRRSRRSEQSTGAQRGAEDSEGYSYTQSGARGFAQPGSTSSPPQSPAASSSFLLHPLHPHQMAMEPPRTRSRSRSGYYQQYGGGGNGTGFTGSGVMGSNHHQLHHQQTQLYPQQQQHGAGCAPLGAHSHHPEHQQRSPGSNISPGIQRLSSVPGAHRIPAAGASGGSYHCYPDHAYGEESDKSEESPSPKRQRLSSQSVLEQLTSSAPPPSTPSPPIRPWESGPSSRRQPHPQIQYHQERCLTPARHRRSPPARRQRGRLSRPMRHLPPHLHPSTQGPAPRLSPSELQDENFHHNPHPPHTRRTQHTRPAPMVSP